MVNSKVTSNTFLTHPQEFYYLCLATMCEKFSFHAIRFSNVIYMTKALLLSDTEAYLISGSTLALTFMFPIIGGWIGDKITGYYRMCLLGAVFVAGGLSLLILPMEISFYIGMGLIACGGGFLRAGIPALASVYFEDNKEKRDSGFTILYSFVNTGAFLAVFGSCVIGEVFGWHYNFIISSAVALLSIVFLKKGNLFFDNREALKLQPLTAFFERNKLGFYLFSLIFPICGGLIIFQNWILNYLLTLMFLCTLLFVFFQSFKEGEYRSGFLNLAFCMIIQVAFFAMYEQGASSVTLFIDRNVDRSLGNLNEYLLYFFNFTSSIEKIPTTTFQSIDPLVNMLLGASLGYLWWKLAINTISFSFIRFGLGLISEATGFYILTLSGFFVNNQGLVPFWIIPLVYLFTVAGELLVVPLGMSMVTRVAPKTQRGLLLGFWNLSIAAGQWSAGVLSCATSINDKTLSHAESIEIYSSAFCNFGAFGILSGIFVIILSTLLFNSHRNLLPENISRLKQTISNQRAG
ncbi:MAG: oligopeptide:H+ symporter [Alphaproteobacteria bacterium]|nr:oligopeptide:H+ symporter [Alphaproteobacteria bacterium]